MPGLAFDEISAFVIWVIVGIVLVALFAYRARVVRNSLIRSGLLAPGSGNYKLVLTLLNEGAIYRRHRWVLTATYIVLVLWFVGGYIAIRR